MFEERDRLIEELSDWVISMDFKRQSEEVKELIQHLEREHRAYPQLIVNVEEN
jgi:hypothetical protein